MPIDTGTSSAFLTGKWEVDIHPLGSRVVLECDDASITDEDVPMKCSSRCRAPETMGVDVSRNLSGVPVTVPFVYLSGSFDGGKFSISMKNTQLLGGLRLDANHSPLLAAVSAPNFWLEGLMTVKILLKGSDRPMSLVSRNPVLQTGRAESWPPYNTMMSDRSGPNEYVAENGNPNEVMLTLWAGSITIKNGPVDYLEVGIPVRNYQVNPGANRGLLIEWDDVRERMPVVQAYNVYKLRADGALNLAPPQLLGRNLTETRFVDATFDDQQLYAYQIRPIHTDVFGTELVLGSEKAMFFAPTQPVHRDQLSATGFN